MLTNIKTMDDVDFYGKRALVRIDINTPIDLKTGELLDDRRFKSHRETLRELIDKNAKIILLAHQGRPGNADFTTMEKHAKRLGEIIDHDITYIDSIFSSYVIEGIKNMKNSDIILLENVRFYSEEVLNRPPDAQSKTFLVQRLSKVVDVYVDDAFATAHRSQPSMVGFPLIIESVAGRLMEKELKSIDKIMKNPKKPMAFVLGGTKADDSLRASRLALENGTEYILAGGVVGNIFLAAKGYRIGEPSIEFIRGKRMVDQIDVAKDLLNDYGDRIILPIDLALDNHGERMEIPVSELPKNFRISDIGKETVNRFKEIIKKCGTIFAKGALGIFEEKNFSYGTIEIVKAIADSKAFSVIGGGHLVASARGLNIEDKITHISSGGGACISLLAGYKLPAVEALRQG
ncbi:MAG: phosphoglycerate kinase [Candidatus Altiarchaeales archaeon ex4484_43]|nr:MAG: phosphoglycerate kinase [Candidatus Altiarchaeales archaeon ex4484_43]